jgi:lantibiotic biosynthesis protein
MIEFGFGVNHAYRFAKRAEVLLPDHPSLFSGLSGLSLLYSNLFLISKNEADSKKAIELLEKSIELLSDGKADLTLANGVAGVGWLVKYLIKKQILTPADADVLADFDELLVQSLKIDALRENSYYDFLFGLIGKGVYFFEDDRPVNAEALELIFQRLKRLAIEGKEGKLWYDILGKEQRNEQEYYYNYGLAHGLPSIVIFLSNLFDKGIQREQCKEFTQSIISHLQKQRLENEISEYPSFSSSRAPSRLAWCYGDLGITFAFIRAAKTLEKPLLMSEASSVTLASADRQLNRALIRTEDDSIENGFCHGTSGLAYLFNQLHSKIADNRLIEARDYWLSSCFGLGTKDILSREYFAERKMWRETGGLLNGYCGMGLVLLNLIEKKCDGLKNITLTE